MRFIESGEQRALFYWAWLLRKKHPALNNMFRIPNGGQRTARQGARSKQEGERPGVPDLMLAWPVAPYHGFFIEMKKDEKEALKPEQEKWRGQLITAGYKHGVFWNWHQAAKEICAYLGIECEGI